MNQGFVIIRPVITEQSMKEANKGKFSFVVARSADKTVIKQAIEEAYKVHVTSVITVTTKGRTKRVGTRRAEKALSPVKKAVVALRKGEKIGLFEIST